MAGDFDAPREPKHGFAPTKREACAALKGTWRLEAEWLARVRAVMETTHGYWSGSLAQHVFDGRPLPVCRVGP